MPKYKFEREDILSQGETAQMIGRVGEVESHRVSPRKFKALLAFLYLFGSRISEALPLKKKDFWMEGDNLAVKLQVLKQRKRAGPFKTYWRILRISTKAPFMEILLDYLDSVKDPDERLWCFAENPEYNRWLTWDYIKKLNQKCSSHIFRHSRLTKLALKRATGPELMEWAGHSDPRSIAKYLHAAGHLAEKFADKIE